MCEKLVAKKIGSETGFVKLKRRRKASPQLRNDLGKCC